ncbi:hypothetical protein NLU13_3838 [Sarocladium strictum]|uniref:FAR-17a/AIG1-like protein n=1 Tax=Sarocladium strictum TaxID=5046 RepID=A0AA39GHS5_SARSR|nr:hypothetical protein NLU13_3838 [Sarocladium strictum]
MSRHPLQRLTAPSRSLSLILHAAGILSFTYNFLFLYSWETPISGSYGSHFQFLTILGLAASLIAFILGLAADITLNQTLFQLKNAINVITTPLEFVISVLYWGIHLINPELLFADEFRLPLLTDIGFHLAPAVFLTADLILFSPPWTIPAYAVMLLSTGLAFMYWYWVELCFSVNGWYPYPMFAVLNTTQRALLFTFAAGLSTMSSVALKWVYGKVNGFEAIRREAHKPLKKVQ